MGLVRLCPVKDAIVSRGQDQRGGGTPVRAIVPGARELRRGQDIWSLVESPQWATSCHLRRGAMQQNPWHA